MKKKKKKMSTADLALSIWRVLVIVTLMAIAAGTFKIGNIDFKIVSTQIRLIYNYANADKVSYLADKYKDEANDTNLPSQRRIAAQNQSETYKEAYDEYVSDRTSLKESADPVVAWAAKYDRDIGRCIIGVLVFFAIILSLILINKFFMQIIIAEEFIVKWLCFLIVQILVTVVQILKIVSNLLICLARICRKIYKAIGKFDEKEQTEKACGQKRIGCG